MTTRRPLVAGNWKMHLFRAEAAALAAAVAEAAGATSACEVGIFPPFTAIEATRVALGGAPVVLGAQACHVAEKGAHTGEISAAMLVDAGCRAVLCGHSERRAAGVGDDAVGERVRAALGTGLRAVLCVGETLDEREAGATATVVRRQLDAGLAWVKPEDLPLLDVAYEPVWAIGTGRTATPEIASEAHAEVRAVLEARFGEPGREPRILYGGSVKPGNAAELLGTDGVSGVLVGGASLDAASFAGIIDAA